MHGGRSIQIGIGIGHVEIETVKVNVVFLGLSNLTDGQRIAFQLLITESIFFGTFRTIFFLRKT